MIEFKKLCQQVTLITRNNKIDINPKLLQVYVDDTDTVTKRLPDDAIFDQENMRFNFENNIEDDTCKIPHDEKIAKVYQILANSVSKDLKFTVDYPSANVNGKIPILDTEMWIEDNDEKSVIRYRYYEKPMIPNRVIENESAVPWTMRKPILVAEGLRRLLRCNIDTPWVELKEHLQKYCWKLFNSGYTKGSIRYIINQTINKYRNMVTDHYEGKTPLHRDKYGGKEKGRRKKKNRKMNGTKKVESMKPLYLSLGQKIQSSKKNVRK